MGISSLRTTCDGEVFKLFRELIYKHDYLIILKIKNQIKYEFYVIIPNEEIDTSELDTLNGFYYIKSMTHTFQKVDGEIFNLEVTERVINGKNILIYGSPGVGKSWTVENEYCSSSDVIERVVFYPDYTYSDFIGQILPKLNGDKISYEFSPGPFTLVLSEAYINPTKKFFLVIEEINRGNAPAIFGDVFQLL